MWDTENWHWEVEREAYFVQGTVIFESFIRRGVTLPVEVNAER